MSSKPSDAASEDTRSEHRPSGSGPAAHAAAAGTGPALASTAKFHDALFRRIFGQPAHAAEAVRAILPPQVAAHFDWNSFVAEHASVVSEGFEQRHGDLQFRARLVDSRQAFVRLLFEHQSSVEHWMSWRMTDMTHAFLRDARQRHPEARYLPAMLPVVLYQGSRPWTAPTSLLELTDLSEEARRDLGPYLLSLRYVLDELRMVDVGEIDARTLSPVPRLTLGIMKHYQSGTVLAFLHDHAEDIRVLYANEPDRIWLALMLEYTWSVNPHAKKETVAALVADMVGDDIEKTMETLEQLLRPEIFEQGVEKGMEKGMEKGVVKGQRELLLRLLTKRFGPLQESVTRRVADASTKELEHWGERILDAASLDDVFVAS
ncbi:MAG TPA: Rpn family recombination-promoting nuclease/putative transposase [Haliangium sp.]|nr:Rpn family recombination-promoting nuclease/putative transposase [Haliangium sp.]